MDILILAEISGYVKIFKVKDGNKNQNTKLMSFRMDDDNLLEKHKTIWNKIEDFKNIELQSLSVYADRYRKRNTKTFVDKVYTNFLGLNVPDDDI